MKWIKRDAAVRIEDVVERNTGIPIHDFLNPPTNVHIGGLTDAAIAIQDAVVNNELITIYGDYDVDGITSTAILFLTLVNLGHEKVSVILPKRFSEGYGLSQKGVDRIDTGLLITIDNGITAINEIQAAKDKGLKVVVIDHHLPREDGQIPNADVVVDPNAIPGSDFNGYCGAGLAFKLACLLLDDEETIDKLSALAAIGTVADVMPLVNDNRNIVIRGLKRLSSGKNLPGLAALLNCLDMYEVSEGDIGFKLGPVLNAAGRMRDAGATEAFELLVKDKAFARVRAEALISTNEERKAVVLSGMECCEEMIADQCLFGDSPLLLYTTKEDPVLLHEGIVGILAGRLAEKYKVPVIVLSETEGGILKGSGRSYGNIHLKQLLDSAADLLVGYGGHAGAAGLSVTQEKVEDLRDRLKESMAKLEITEVAEPDTEFYDIEVNAHQIPAVMEKLKMFAPFGEGNPQPVFKVNTIRLAPRGGKFYRLMGNEGQHIKMFGQNCDVVGFDMATQYRDANEPACIDALGYISENRFGATVTLQVELMDFHPKEIEVTKSRLANALAQKMKEKGLS